MQLLITEVTDMHGDHYCVAGWCAAEARMVRPLPRREWNAAMLDSHGIAPGAIVAMTQTASPQNGAFPHRTDDRLIYPNSIRLVRKADPHWAAADLPPAVTTLRAAFPGAILSSRGAHVPRDTRIGSLAAVTVPADKLRFHQRNRDGAAQLRAYLNDGEGAYDLPAVARDLRELWRAAGLNGLNQSLTGDMLHVRLGLARGFGDIRDKCYVMVNGVYG